MKITKLEVVFYSVFSVFCFGVLFLSWNQAIWADEAFTLALLDHNYIDIIRLTAQDVHPPLYYLILKTVSAIFGSSIALMRMFSILPLFLQILLSVTLVKKYFGAMASALFSVASFAMPQMLYYGFNIRMYSYCLLFVTGALLYSYAILYDSETKSLKHWSLFSLFVLAASYSHYFACVAVIIIEALLFLLILITKKHTLLKRWFAFGTITALLYLPWIFILFGQLSNVKKSYWIDPITMTTLIDFFRFPFCGFNRLEKLLLLAVGLYLCYWLLRHFTELSNQFMICCILVPLGTIAIGVLVSLFFKPVFYKRYILPTLGCFWLFFSISITKIKYTKVKYLYAALFIIAGLLSAKNFTSDQIKINHNLNAFNAFLESNVRPEDTFNYDTFHLATTLPIYSESTNNTLLLSPSDKEYTLYYKDYYNKVFSKQNLIYSDRISYNTNNSKGSVWMIDFTQNDLDLKQEALKANRKIQDFGIYHLSFYDFHIYKLLSK